jgi:pimeloyl-ACP methyl ester carboxylesterase
VERDKESLMKDRESFSPVMAEPQITQAIVLPDGRRLGFAEYGDPGGRPVFHFHGSAGSRLDRPADERILWDQGIRFISVERPGHGQSDFQRNRRLTDWPKDISRLADSLGLAEFYLEGWSAGGPHALACARYFPDRVKAVALIASAAPMNRPAAFAGLPLPNLVLAASARWAPALTYLVRWLTRSMVMRNPQQASQRLMASLPEADKAALYTPDNLAVFVESIREGYRPGSRGVAHDDVVVNRDWGSTQARSVSPWTSGMDTPTSMFRSPRLSTWPLCSLVRARSSCRARVTSSC